MQASANPDSPAVELVAYDPSWPTLFCEERDALRVVLGPSVPGPIEHVGSTAVPALLAKPIVDIMIGVTTLADWRGLVAAVAPLGYLHFPYRPDVMHWFCKPSAAVRTHHLHAVPIGSQLWRDRLGFRDYLRGHADVADEYARLKQELAARHRYDREAYTDAKTPFVDRVLQLASAR